MIDPTIKIEVIIAATAVFISVISLFVAIWTLRTQQKHNRLSVKPIAHLSYGDYLDQIFVEFKNRGIGPLLVDRFRVYRNGQEYNELVCAVDNLPEEVVWDTFTGPLDGAVLTPNQSFSLVKISFKTDQHELRDAIRKSLSTAEIVIYYKSIYEEQQPIKRKSLSWFAR